MIKGNMDSNKITLHLMHMLEMKLEGKVDSFDANKLTTDITRNLIENLTTKFANDLHQMGQLDKLNKEQVTIFCLEGAAQMMLDEPKAIYSAFSNHVVLTQDQSVHADSFKLGKYLIGALPYLIGEFLSNKDLFPRKFEESECGTTSK